MTELTKKAQEAVEEAGKSNSVIFNAPKGMRIANQNLLDCMYTWGLLGDEEDPDNEKYNRNLLAVHYARVIAALAMAAEIDRLPIEGKIEQAFKDLSAGMI